jgi:hypothetical protein
MSMRKILLLGCAALLAGCSNKEEGPSDARKDDVVAAEAPATPGAEPLKVGLPQLAYHYTLNFLLPDARRAIAWDRRAASWCRSPETMPQTAQAMPC